MNYRQKNQANMFYKVKAVLVKFAEFINGIEPLKVASDKFTSKVQELEDIVGIDALDGSGATVGKKGKKNVMAEMAVDLALAGIDYANDHNMPVLEAALDYSVTDIKKATDTVAAAIVKNIADALEALVPQLDDYLVTAEDISRLRNLRQAFLDHKEDQDETETTGVVNTQELVLIIKEINNLLNIKLDSRISRIKEKNPALFKEYEQARKIIDAHHTSSTSEPEVITEGEQ